MPPTPHEAWQFLPIGYLLTIAIEIPVLLFGLSRRHPTSHRLLAGVWLTACTYPVVALVLPYVVWQSYGRVAYLAVAETFAPLAECGLFYLVYVSAKPSSRLATLRDFTAIIAANLASFVAGEFIFA